MNLANFTALCDHALAEYPKEACGLLVSIGGKEVYQPCRNIAETPDQHFTLAPEDYLAAELAGKILAVCHSHPDGSNIFSDADRSGCEASGLPWYVVSVPGYHSARITPCGFKAPLIGREFVHGTHDCYGLVRDYYAQTLNITLPDYERQDGWWDREENLYLDNFRHAGFHRVEDVKLHDVILMQIRAAKVNHSAVYVSDGNILQHLHGHLSGRTVYGGFWAKHTHCIVRHESQL